MDRRIADMFSIFAWEKKAGSTVPDKSLSLRYLITKNIIRRKDNVSDVQAKGAQSLKTSNTSEAGRNFTGQSCIRNRPNAVDIMLIEDTRR
jgi:hypothetical protein